MKKFFTLLGLMLFMGGAIYLLLNEDRAKRITHRKKQHLLISASKAIGEKPSHDLRPFDLQRQRIESEMIVKFENTDTRDSYELHETELEVFSRGLNTLKKANSGEQFIVRPNGAIEDKERNYYDE